MPRRPGSRLIGARAPYAANPAASRGRQHSEAAPAHRGAFQRDRDRIIHSSAFRRLEYKTQVFVNHEGDMFRTRLTHSIEVAQLARTIARALDLDEDLIEAIALAHDLGHTPFGHAGQHALNQCMREFGGFEHNLQSLRTVDYLEQKYAAFPGLNLSFETREGILKHCTRERAAALGEVGRRFLDGTQPSLEAQVTNLADEIAYNNHDVDDGLRAGLISIDALRKLELFGRHHAEVARQWPGLVERTVIYEVVRRMINTLVTDLIETSRTRIAELAPRDIETVRRAPEPLIAFSPPTWEMHLQLKRFLRRELYRHYRVHRMTVKAGRIIRALFAAFMDDEALLPPEARVQGETDEVSATARHARAVADYIAGMTDRYAIAEHERIYNPIELT